MELGTPLAVKWVKPCELKMVPTVGLTPNCPSNPGFQFDYVIPKTKKSVSMGFELILA